MGTQISANYDNIQQITTADLWTIHSAVSHVSKEKVCLWVLNVQKLKERYKKKAVRFRYIDVILNSLQQMRKYRHPRILKILEIAEKKPEIGFSSEPFDKIVSSQISDVHPMDVAYISYQVAEVLGFLSNEARIVHLGINPTAVLLDDQLSVKITQFQWSSPIDSLGNVTPSQTYEQLYNEFADVYAKAPEMLKKNSSTKLTAEADIFIFGMFVYEAFTGHKFYDSDDPETILTSLSTRHAQIKGESKIPADFMPLLTACLNPDPEQRPNITTVLQHPAYQSMQLKSLRYIDIMLTKNPSDKFAFYKGLSKKIDEFSPSIQRIKLLPTLVNECIGDVRFAPILLGAIFQISVKFTTEEFMDLVWRKLSVLATVVNPPEVSIGLLRNLWMLLEKVDKRLHKDYVYPIIFSALNSQETRIHNEVLKHVDTVIDEMNEETLRSLILPRLFDLSFNSSNLSVSSSSIMCISKTLKRMDNESFCAEFIPKFAQIWRKFANPQIATPILDVFFNLNVSLDVVMLRILPLACEISANNSVDGELRSKYCNFIIKTAQDFRDKGENERNFNDQENVQGKQNESDVKVDNDNPFAIQTRSSSTSALKSASTASANSVLSSTVNASPNPFAINDDEEFTSSFGTKTARSNSDDTFASGNNNKNEPSKPVYPTFDSPNPFAKSLSASKSKKDDDDDDGFGKRKNVFSFSNSNASNNSSNLSNDVFSHNDNNSTNFSNDIFSQKDSNTVNSSKNVFGSSDNAGISSKENPNHPFSVGGSKDNSENPFGAGSSSKGIFGHNDNNNSRDIFGSGSSNSGLSRKKTDDFEADSVFSKRDSDQSTTTPKMPSSQPFTEDIFKNKAFQESADDIFGAPASKPSNSVFQSSTTNQSTSVFSNPTTSPSTSVFSNSSSNTNPSTSVFSNPSSSNTNPSTSVFSNPSSQSQPSTAISDFSSNLGIGPISANDIFGSSTAQTSVDSYIGNVFGQNSSMDHPIPAPISLNSSPAPSSSSNTAPSGLGMHATKHQLGSGGFGDFGSSFSSNPPQSHANSQLSGSTGPIISAFGTGFDDTSNRTSGFGSSNFSSPASLSGFPPVGGSNSGSKQGFNPFQSDNDHISSSPLSGLSNPQQNQSQNPPRHGGGGFNPFQSENGGGGRGSSDGIPRANDTNSVFTSSGRIQRNSNNAGAFQFGQGGGMNQPSGAIPRKKPTQSASYDILDIFS